MTISELITKLDALRTRTKWLEGAYYNTILPRKLIDNVLEQLTPAVEELRGMYPHMLDGFEGHNYAEHLHTNDYKPVDNGKFYNRSVAHYIIGDINYYLDIIPPPPKVRDPLPTLKVTKEGIFLSGEYFDAFLKMSEIVHSATKDVIVIDGYIDQKLLSLFTKFEGKVNVRILTFKIGLDLQVFIDDFNRQYKNSLQVKTNKDFHDRFLIIDESEFYHIGASIKDAGNRGFMFSQIEETFIKEKLLEEFKSKW